MNKERKIFAGVLCAAFVLGNCAPVFSQQKQATSDVMVVHQERLIQGPDGPGTAPHPGEDSFYVVTSEMSFDGKLVKGAPYSADAVTEITQTLGDGNRIVNKSTAAIYRDSEGRTRREQTLRAIGAFATGSDSPQTIFISDPVAGTTYMLDARSHVARKTSAFRFEYKTAGPKDGLPAPPPAGGVKVLTAPEAGMEQSTVTIMRTPGPGTDVMMTAPRVASAGGMVMEMHGDSDGKNAKKESLGKQVIEGVEAEGTRTTVTIAAGEIGNERAIEMVSERWYSPELKTVVMTKHSDPRFGETVYRLTNINRSEPAKSLFEVPGDYTVKEGPSGPPMQIRMRKPATDQ